VNQSTQLLLQHITSTHEFDNTLGTLHISDYALVSKNLNRNPIHCKPKIINYKWSSGLCGAGIVTSYGLDDRGVGVRVPVGSRIFTSPNRPDWL
jgi:uncharacterized membrane protein YdcZ (DUF606 family)